MVEARGSLEKLSAKAHVFYGEKNKKKERGRAKNLLMQDINAISHKKKKCTIPTYIFFDFEKHNKWSKLQQMVQTNSALTYKHH